MEFFKQKSALATRPHVSVKIFKNSYAIIEKYFVHCFGVWLFLFSCLLFQVNYFLDWSNEIYLSAYLNQTKEEKSKQVWENFCVVINSGSV